MDRLLKFVEAPALAILASVTGGLMALKEFSQLESLSFWEAIAVGAIVAAGKVVHDEIEGSQSA